jgi:hypothetical protein
MSDALDHVLAPLCRLFVARGVGFADLVERLKGHYVQAALQLVDNKPTDSRLSVMTGLQRREISRLREFRPRPSKPNHLSRLVALWQAHPDYAPDGQAIALPRTGDAPSFEALARDVRKDVHPRTMLDTLEQTGTVEIDAATQKVRLMTTAYRPLSGGDEQLTYLDDNVGDHLAAATANVLGQKPAFFERSVHYSGLSEAQISTLTEMYHQAQMDLLEKLNREAATMKAKAPKGAATRFRAGGYFYAEGQIGK